jgi:hypothetical protein
LDPDCSVSVVIAVVDLVAATELPTLEMSIVLCPLLYFKKKKLFFKKIN